MNKFLESHKLPKLAKKKIANLDNVLSVKEIESVI